MREHPPDRQPSFSELDRIAKEHGGTLSDLKDIRKALADVPTSGLSELSEANSRLRLRLIIEQSSREHAAKSADMGDTEHDDNDNVLFNGSQRVFSAIAAASRAASSLRDEIIISSGREEPSQAAPQQGTGKDNRWSARWMARLSRQGAQSDPEGDHEPSIRRRSSSSVVLEEPREIHLSHNGACYVPAETPRAALFGTIARDIENEASGSPPPKRAQREAAKALIAAGYLRPRVWDVRAIQAGSAPSAAPAAAEGSVHSRSSRG